MLFERGLSGAFFVSFLFHLLVSQVRLVLYVLERYSQILQSSDHSFIVGVHVGSQLMQIVLESLASLLEQVQFELRCEKFFFVYRAIVVESCHSLELF